MRKLRKGSPVLGLEYVLIPALSGYLFLTRSHKHKAEISRLSGYHVLFRSATRGLVVLFLTHVFIKSIVLPYFPATEETWTKYVPVFFPISSTLSFLVCLLHACCINVRITEQQGEIEAARENGDLIEILIHECIGKRMMMEVTLKNRKVYIGTPLDTGFTRTGDHDIWIVPFASGYRDETNLDLHITTKYDKITTKSNRSRLAYQDFKVVIPVQEITSARLFDKNVYRTFKHEMYFNPPGGRFSEL